MDQLVKLQLDNNIITKIQGLETLTKLKWLDLSFNLIEKIEGLESLVLLEDLSLYSNHIEKLEGLDTLENLNVLSVGANCMKSLDDAVRYLFQLRNNLEVLKINQNEFKEQGDKEYKGRIIAYLSKLKYLDYELIEQKEKEKAEGDFKNELETAKVDNEEQRDNTDLKDQYKELEEAHILPMANLFIECCKAFEDYEKIKGFQKFNEQFQYSDANIEELITNV